MFLFVGLGNPGKRYVQTRHNVGFMALDTLYSVYGFSHEQSRWDGMLAKGLIAKHHIFGFKPGAFMNLSVGPVQKALMGLKVALDRVLVFHDDVDLPLGVVRYKKGGGDAGHNGLRSLSEHLGAKYHRVRIGIGAPEKHLSGKRPISAYVLDNLTPEEDTILKNLLPQLADAFGLFLSEKQNAWMRALSALSSAASASAAASHRAL